MKFNNFKIINKGGKNPKNIIDAFLIAGWIYQEQIEKLKRILISGESDALYIYNEKYKFCIITK